MGGYYHDIGKIAKSTYFGENLREGMRNPHEKLTPHMSTLILESHVREGLELAREIEASAQEWDSADRPEGMLWRPPKLERLTALVERSVDDRLAAAVGDLRLADLLGEAKDRHRRSAANYVI